MGMSLLSSLKPYASIERVKFLFYPQNRNNGRYMTSRQNVKLSQVK